MKRFLIILAALLVTAAVASAQPRAVGVRLSYGGELSYQHYLGGNNFAEIDLGWTMGSVSVSAAYDFSVTPVGPFDFYVGPQVSAWLIKDSGVHLGAGAQIGLEYCFDAIPLQLSLDWKPTFRFVPATGFRWEVIALGIRYLF